MTRINKEIRNAKEKKERQRKKPSEKNKKGAR